MKREKLYEFKHVDGLVCIQQRTKKKYERIERFSLNGKVLDYLSTYAFSVL